MGSSKEMILSLRHKINFIETLLGNEETPVSFTDKLIRDFNQQKLLNLNNSLKDELRKADLEYFSLCLNGEGIGHGRAPIKKIAEFLGSLQSTVENIGQSISEGPKERGRISHAIQFGNEITLEALTAGSVRLELSANAHLGMFSKDDEARKESIVVKSLDTFFDALGGNDPDETLEKLVPLGNNVVRSFSGFLTTALENNFQVKSTWLDIEGKINNSELTHEYANMTLLKISQIDDVNVENITLEGKIVSISFEKNRLTFRPDDLNIKEFNCFWADDLKPQYYDNGVYYIPEYVQGIFQKETKRNIATGNKKIYWSLMDLKKISKER